MAEWNADPSRDDGEANGVESDDRSEGNGGADSEGSAGCDCRDLADHPFRDMNDYEFNHKDYEKDPAGFVEERMRACGCADDVHDATGDREPARPESPPEAHSGDLDPASHDNPLAPGGGGVFDRGSGGRAGEFHLNLEGTQYVDLYFFAIARGFTVTSTTGGQHNSGSLHPLGRAIDVRTWDKTPEEIEKFVRQAEAAGISVRDERAHPPGQKQWSGAHLHLSLPTRAAMRAREAMPSLTAPGRERSYHLFAPESDLRTLPRNDALRLP